MFFLILFPLFFLLNIALFGGGVQGQKADVKEQEMSAIKIDDVEKHIE